MIYRTYIRWKYTFMFVLVFYIQWTYLCPTLFPPLFLISIILYKETLFPAHSLPFPPLSFRTFVYLYILLYTLYREEHTFPQLFTLFLYFYYTPIIYRRGNILPAPFLPLYIYSYKVNTFSTAHFLTLIVWGKVCGEKFLKTLLV